MSVSATHPDYDENVSKWQLVRDVIKSNVKQYIKNVELQAIEDANGRNTRYKDDARFTNFTARTKNGLVGAVFNRDTKIDLPESVDYLIKDATGAKMGLQKLAKEVTGEVLQSGRFGLLVDYPSSREGLTAAEQEALNLKARIVKYKAENIINWQSQVINGNYILTLVVLMENTCKLADDGFSWVESKQYRVLRLEDGVYSQYLFDEAGDIQDRYEPRNNDGQTWSEIPFVFVGAEDNDSEIDPSPLYDLAELNIGHLRNSADYEESVHITGQPTLIISTDMSAEQFKALNPNGVQIGARRGQNLGAGGSAMMLQAAPNQLADEAMKRKEEQAVMIGARLIQAVSSNETAEAARIKHSGENSVLSGIVDNVEGALIQCVYWCLEFMTSNYNEDDVVLELNKVFFDVSADAQTIMAQIQLFNNGILAAKDIRDHLRKTGLIKGDRTDEDIEDELSRVNPLIGGFGNDN